jgi:hypothetical protein
MELLDDLASAAILALVEFVKEWDLAKVVSLFYVEYRRAANRLMREVLLNWTRPVCVTKKHCKYPVQSWERRVQAKKMAPESLRYLELVTEPEDELSEMTTEPRVIAEVDAKADVGVMLGVLPPRERDLVERHHGLGGRAPEVLQAIAVNSGCKPSSVWWVHYQAMNRMRDWASLQTV